MRLAASAIVGLAVVIALGVGYAERHSTHEGFFRVTVHDEGPSTLGFTRPRRTVVVVVDGLGHVEADAMPSLARIAAIGQCRTTAVGPLSISRPVYAVISTGLDQDRTGARGNDDTSPLAAESVWEIARRRGLRVAAISEAPWWRELFPRGFDTYVERVGHAFDVASIPDGDLVLVHPVYVDDVGHALGADSPAYGAAVARVDGTIDAIVRSLDLARDLVVVTADHGQMPHGGHGGRQDRVAHVRSCFAGRGVRPLAPAATGEWMRSTTLAPALTVWLGLPFPSDMRAGEDDLDTIFALTDPDAFPPGYLDERRGVVQRFRDANAAQLRRWLPSSEGRWSRFRAHGRAMQALAAIPCALCVLAVLFFQARTHRRRGRSLGAGLAFALGLPAAMVATQLVVRGSFDLSAVSTRQDFLLFTIGMALAWCGLALALDRRALEARITDWTALVWLVTLAAVSHPVVFGWRVGYPAPPAELFFHPYFVTLAGGTAQAVALAVAAAQTRWRRRSGLRDA